MITNRLALTALAAALVSASPAAAQQQMSATATIGIPTASSVAAVYSQHRVQPMWFRNGSPTSAAAALVQILRRSVVEGLASGPQLASQVEAAIAQSKGGGAALNAAEQTLSSAWVQYVQTIRRPTANMTYAFKVLEPQGTRADQILLVAAAAPALEQHVASVSNLNHIYNEIRDTEWARMQATGSLTPDPRVVANLDRVRSIPSKGRFVLVDSASQRLWMYENGRPVDSMKIIVGMSDPVELQTPLIASIMYYITYNPYWNAPDHLVRNAIAKKTLAGGMKYFNSMGYEVMADWTEASATIPADTIDWKAVSAGKQHLRIRQKPGKDNFMGTLKFPFPNQQDIYLHDTPAKDKFKVASRNLSNGCVRLEDAQRFGRWLLGREPIPPGSEPEIRAQLPQGVPIYLTYITAQASNGQITYLKDIYGWDRAATQRIASAGSSAGGAQ